MKRFIIIEKDDDGIYDKNQGCLCHISIRDSLTKALTNPDTVKITITSESGDVLTNEKSMVNLSTGVYTYDFGFSATDDYCSYDIKISVVKDAYTTEEVFKKYVMPWRANTEVRKLTGIGAKKSISDAALNGIVYESWKEVREKVFKYYKDKPLPNPDTGIFTDGTNTTFRLPHIPVADYSDNGEVEGKHADYPYRIHDAEATWKDEDGGMHYANLTIDDKDWGDITLTKSAKDVFVLAGYHKLFANSSGNALAYVYDSGSWTTEAFATGVAASFFIQYNNVLYGFSQNHNAIYSYNNTTGLWTTVTEALTSPYRAVVYEDCLYISTKSNSTVWKYDGTTFTNCGAPGSSSYGLAVLDNELYSADQDGSALYKYISYQDWVKACDVAVAPSEIAAYNEKIYMRCYDDIYTWDGVSCVEDYNDLKGRIVQVYKDILYVTSSYSHKVYSTDGGGWTTAKDLSNAFTMSIVDEELYVRYGVGANDYIKYDGSTWTSIGNYGAAGNFMGGLDVDDEYTYGALPSTACDVEVEYRISSVTFDRELMHQAVNYLAAHKILLRFGELERATSADLNAVQNIKYVDPKRMLKEYKRILRKIKFPLIGGSK